MHREMIETITSEFKADFSSVRYLQMFSFHEMTPVAVKSQDTTLVHLKVFMVASTDCKSFFFLP